MIWAALLVLGVAGALTAGVFVTDTLLDLWERLQQVPWWLRLVVAGIAGAVTLPLLWLLVRFWRPPRPASARPREVRDERDLEAALADAEARGIDVAEARRQLADWTARRGGGRIQIAVAGEVSAGKSSLIRALLPEEDVVVSVRAGSTREVRNYTWTSAAGDELIVTDLPGLGDEQAALIERAEDEAARAHVVVFLCAGDLTGAEYAALERLAALAKPMVVALNKRDRYVANELDMILAALRKKLDRLSGGGGIRLVGITAGGEEQLRRVLPDGREETILQPREAHIEPLLTALNDILRQDQDMLRTLRDAAILSLIAGELEQAGARHRRTQSEQIVRSYTRKAVVGALAAVSPGTDLVIQGYLGTAMMRELTGLYGVAARDLDIQTFLDLSQSQLGRALPLMLAVSGNALKAFPGMGTVAGGLVHAVAYGLIFDALGHSVARTLELGIGLEPQDAARRFREELGEDLENRTRRLVALALDARKDAPD
jgi:GTP-binding protein EngB required for normal cell division